MLTADIPKTVNIIVKHAENLEYSVPGSKKSAKTRRWCVVFIGGKKKMVTHTVESQEGCPVWDCEVSMELVSPTDPLVMLVLDAERRHIGQVVVPLAQIPRNGPPNFDPSRLQYSELEPTKKNSTPRGRLVYWMWATSYWPPGTKLESSKSKSIRGSLSHLGRSRSKHQLRGSHPFPMGGFNDPNATFSCDDRSSRAPSMVSGAYSESNISGGASSLYGGGPSDLLSVRGGDGGMAPMNTWNSSQAGSRTGALGSSYNPLDATGPHVEGNRLGGDDDVRPLGRPPIFQSTFNLAGPGRPDHYAESSLSGRSGKPRGLLKKMRNKMSKSTQNLAVSVAKKAGGDKLYGDSLDSMSSIRSSRDLPPFPDSTSGPRPPSGSILSFSRDSYPPDGSTKPNGEDSLYKPEITSLPRNEIPTDNSGTRLPSPLSAHSLSWGLHPEERPKKPLEEMSHRELMNYAMQLERSSHVTRAELLRVQGERDVFSKKVTTTESELHTVRNTLADLRFRLLAAGLTEFLELPTTPGKMNGIMSGAPFTDPPDRKRQIQSYNDVPSVDGYQTFFDKLTSLTSNARKSVQNIAMEEPIAVAPASSTDWW